jgi:F-type H+-transporting ATPase subunit b
VLAEAREAETRASALKGQFESRLSDWEQEKTAARERFEGELALDREHHLEALAQALNEERERSAAQDAHRQETLRRELVAEAGAEARQFAARMLYSVAGPELEARLVELFMAELAGLLEQRRRLAQVAERRLRLHGQFQFVQDPALLAGVRLSLGAWQLDFSLAGELGVYAEIGGFAR